MKVLALNCVDGKHNDSADPFAVTIIWVTVCLFIKTITNYKYYHSFENMNKVTLYVYIKTDYTLPSIQLGFISFVFICYVSVVLTIFRHLNTRL